MPILTVFIREFKYRLYCVLESIIYIYIYIINQEFWKELVVYFRFIRHGPHRKRPYQQFFVAAEKFLHSCYLAKIGVT
jgi:hypothetical protein